MIHEENGQIIVDELRPMSEAPRDGNYFLVFCHPQGYSKGTFYPYRWDDDYDDFVDEEGCFINNAADKGWIMMPIYRPKDGE